MSKISLLSKLLLAAQFVLVFMHSSLLANDKASPALLLITAESLKSDWQTFADWKTANGKRTQIVTVDEIRQKHKADSVQESIRLCVQSYIKEHSIKWVVLGGDCLPNGKGLVPGGHTTVHRQEPRGIPTDIVYLSSTNWDADGDGIYGEFQDDRKAIEYPDGKVGLGRIPVRTSEDVKAFTEKVIQYESQYPEKGFAKNMVYTCTDSPAYPKVKNSWDKYVSKSWDGSAKRFFSASTPWDKPGQKGSFDLSPGNLTDLINKKSTGKIHIHGHGHLPGWVLEKRQFFSNENVKDLNHTGAYPLITTVSCNTGEFDSQQDPSIVEKMIRYPRGGSVAIVAPVRTGKPHFANRSDFRLMVTEGKLDGTTLTMTRYWENGLGKKMTTGQALMTAKSQMAGDGAKSPNYHLCICELNLLGDPSLDMRSENPQAADFEVPGSLGTGKHKLQWKNLPPQATVCVWKKDDVYQTHRASDKGVVTVTLSPKSTGELKVTVCGSNLNSRSKTILIK